MSQSARINPLPDSDVDESEQADWMHDLTPTTSTESLFDEEGVQRLRVWPTDAAETKRAGALRLIRLDPTDGASTGE